jgi:hypothetical protein
MRPCADRVFGARAAPVAGPGGGVGRSVSHRPGSMGGEHRGARTGLDLVPASLSDVSSILNVYAIVLATLLLPPGGRRRLRPTHAFLAGLVVFGAASLGCTEHRPARADRLPGAAGGRGCGAQAHVAPA